MNGILVLNGLSNSVDGSGNNQDDCLMTVDDENDNYGNVDTCMIIRFVMMLQLTLVITQSVSTCSKLAIETLE